MIVGSPGSGKSHVAQYITDKILGDSTHSFVQIIEPEKTTISIEQVRSLQKFLSLKVPGKQKIRRVCIIEQAETLGVEAQNALLKILEEPPDDTVIMLLTTNDKTLLTTIISRVQTLQLLAIPKQQLVDSLDSRDGKDIDRLHVLSGGLPGLFFELLNNDDHVLSTNIQKAKQYLQATSFERLSNPEMPSTKTEIAAFLQALMMACSGALKVAISKGSFDDYKRWHKRCQLIYEVQQYNAKSISAKLILGRLALEI